MRFAIVSSQTPSNWLSCKIITPNLRTAYDAYLGSSATWYSVTEDMCWQESRLRSSPIWDVACRIHADQPGRLIFLDHLPLPRLLLHALRTLYGPGRMPPVYIHVYGDFSYFAPDWAECGRWLSGERVGFICASDRQAALLRRFISEPDTGTVTVSPFPVDTRKFRFSEASRAAYRRRLGLSSNDIAIVYTGRISMQKNVARLIRSLQGVSGRRGGRTHVLLAGAFDDLGAPYFGVPSRPGQSYQEYRRAIEMLGDKAASSVRWLGHLSQDELVRLYCASDAYASLSLHHDEDFGMSPAEALCTGLPTVLSDWGGYASFADPELCRHVPVAITEKGLRIATQYVQEYLEDLFRTEYTPEERRRAAGRMRANLGLSAVSSKLEAIVSHRPPEFRGFHWRLQKFAESFKQGRAIFPDGPKKGTFYEEIYGAYTSVHADA